MFRFLFRLIPWWIFTLLAVVFAPLSVDFYKDYQRDQMQVQRAIASGPRPVMPLARFTGRVGAFGEVNLNGVLRADLNVQNITFADSNYNYIVLDGETGGPLMAVLVPTDRAGQVFSTIVDGSDANGRVTIQGFLAPSRVGQISRRLALNNGVTRDLIVVEPFLGSRSDALAARAAETQMIFFVSAGITGFLVLMAMWRFRRWRNRAVAKRTHRKAPSTKQSLPTDVAPPPVPTKTPWGGQVTPKAQSAMPALGSTKPVVRDEDLIVVDPPFVSVFPGGGSGFKFKTADEIIRQTFGTLSSLSNAKHDK